MQGLDVSPEFLRRLSAYTRSHTDLPQKQLFPHCRASNVVLLAVEYKDQIIHLRTIENVQGYQKK
jgi:hypothetical protein